MLNHLHIRRFAIIDATELELEPGMTSLTGETGAGKSILLDALGLVLGERADGDSVQQGAERAEISASFTIDELPAVAQWLIDNDLDAEGECLLRRVIARRGASRATINGRPVAVQLLRELGERLVALHGQHSHQTLARPADQRLLLDRFARPKSLQQVAEAYDAWQSVDRQLTAASESQQARQQRLDLLHFHLQEFDQLDIGGLAVGDIETEHRRLASTDELSALGQAALAGLEDEPGALSALNSCVRPLQGLVNLDERLREALDLIESASIQSAEAASLLRNHLSALEQDDTRLAWLDERLAALHRLARKHLVDISDLPATEQALRDELEALESPGASLAELENQLALKRQAYDKVAKALSSARRKSAKALSATITRSMQGLGMSGGGLSIEVASDPATITRHGQDNVGFQVKPNPGVPAAPLSKVASGGELSRISLCIQLATIDSQPVPTLIFDEVDAGIGGAVAETVGRLLRQVGERSQVLCVTHLPQVAAQAHQQLQVSKQVIKGKTSTELHTLDETARCEEIARMLGGAKLTKKSRQHAREMLDSAGA